MKRDDERPDTSCGAAVEAGKPRRAAKLEASDPAALALVDTIRRGDIAGLGALLATDPRLATARLEDEHGGTRTPLHATVEWPAHYPNGSAIATLLLEHGADLDAVCEGWHGETPLHWAASSDDVELLDVLLDSGATIDARGAAVAGGTALDNALGYGCWQCARRLVDRGATIRRPWHAAALGLTAALSRLLAEATPDDVDEAFWHACRGGQLRAARLLLAAGADTRWMPAYDRRSTAEAAAAADGRRRALTEWLHDVGPGSS